MQLLIRGQYKPKVTLNCMFLFPCGKTLKKCYNFFYVAYYGPFIFLKKMCIELAESPDRLLSIALDDAKDRSSGRPNDLNRIDIALKRRFAPYIKENWVIAEQLQYPEYLNFVRGIKDYLNATVGFVVCPDGRIVALSLGDPLVANINRRLQGLPLTRESTRDGSPSLDDPDLAASINTAIKRRNMQGKNPEIVEFIGPHIHSSDPNEGCSAVKTKISASGRFADLGMKHGGIHEYFAEVGERFFSFDFNARKGGGIGTTIDWIHDIYSEGAIVGLREHHKDFDHERTLRENLLIMTRENKIVTTKSLDDQFGGVIDELKIKKGIQGYLNLKDSGKFIENATLIGSISQEITIDEEKKEFQWIPEDIKKDKSPASLRVLGYHLIRNSVYRRLGHIIPGNHDLLHHPETLVSIGPTSALFNRENIPFVQKTPSGQFDIHDVNDGFSLYNLAGSVMTERGIDLHVEGRIVLVTGEYDRSIYRDDDCADAELERIASIVKNNAAKMREKLLAGVSTGEAVVLGCIHAPETRKILAVV